ncbi:MAG: hypothetical protein GF364_11585 [Candidatus Lokiarchaeota archaeon]|nr:hypothetical protein [Candidatus Lokiarchaeota archaeon]
MIHQIDKEIEQEKSIAEKAESFASIILSFTDGFSPAVGSIAGLIPFFFGDPSMTTYIISFILEIVVLFALGAYLAKISQDSILKYGLEMVLAGVITVLISILIGGGHG